MEGGEGGGRGARDHIYINMTISIHTHLHIRIHVHMRIHVRIHIHIPMHIHIRIHIHIDMCVVGFRALRTPRFFSVLVLDTACFYVRV